VILPVIQSLNIEHKLGAF
jgi:hypothetical protein